MCLVECDLRWGIPQDTPSGQIFSTCLEELDRCHQDTLGKPFMVILLGERAGWIPDVAEVPQEIVEKYPWVHGMSVTGTEILHGAYMNSNPNAAFCLRSPSFLAQLPSHDLPRYQQKGWSALMLQSLKEQVWKRFPKEQILTYDCQLLGTDSSTGVDRVKLGFSDEFCTWILKFLQTRILQTFQEESEMLQAEEPSWEQTEKAQHQLFLWQKNQVFLGRELEVQRILEFLHVDPADLKQQSNKPEHKWTEEGAINPGIPLYEVIGEPGLGKSSLIAACINKAIELPCSTVFYHFVGCCPSSVQLSNIVMRLCCHLMPAAQELDDILLKLKNHSGNEEMKDILQKVLAAAPISKDMVLYIFIDGINQLSVPSDVSELLSWLSTEGFLSPFCRCVISRTPRSVSIQSAYNLHLEPLPLESAQRLAVTYLSRYNKAVLPLCRP
ncbi:telomerase protein component 1-like [Spea bombifrons]|uniref:telomerase protein component 1-like n=1 Tax=Spea bombifrons TaxID=233779 RepID=UPI0023493CEB|nr:telomerase protein component 1-like [Spea bombifrons]